MKTRFLLSAIILVVVVALPVFASTSAGAHAGTLETMLGLGMGAISVGMVLNASSIAGLYKSWSTLFNEAMSSITPQYTKIAMVVPSNTRENGYAWLGAWPKMREWLGDRQAHKLEAFDYAIKNKDWETTVEVDRNDIEDDSYGVYSPLFKAMGISAAQHPDEIVFDLLNNGFVGKGYDGKTFFATDHASGSNKASGGGSALSATSFKTAKSALGRVKDSKGRPLFAGVERDILIVGPELEETARLLLNADFISVANGSAQNNMWKNSADLLVTPRITSTTAWFLIRPFSGLLPFIFQNRRSPQFIAKDNPETSDQVFLKKKYLYGADSRDNAGYGLHQLAYGSVGA